MSIHANPNIRIVVLLAIVVLGLSLRLGGLSEKIVWHDEVATRVLAAGSTMANQMQGLYQSQVLSVAEVLKYQSLEQRHAGSSAFDLVMDLARHDPQHPPLYYVLAKVWVDLWGDSVYALRTLSVLFGTLGLVAMYWLMRELSVSGRAAVLAMLFMGISPLFILYAQEAREYALWSLTLLLSSATLLRALRLSAMPDQSTLNGAGAYSSSRARDAWLLYGLSLLLAVYTSVSTLALIFVQTLYVAFITRLQWSHLQWSRALHGFVVTLAAVGFLFLPWALNLLRNFEAFSASMAWSSVIVIPRTAVLRILSLNVTRNIFDFWPDTAQEQWLPIVANGLCTSVIVLSCVWVFKTIRRETRFYLSLLIFLPITMLLVPDLLFGGIRSSNARYLMPVWLGVIVVLALAFDQALQRAKHHRAIKPLLWLGLLAMVGLALTTDGIHARQSAPWTKSLSISLPEVAEMINQSPNPLVVGNQERHHPGNLFALANLLKPEVKMQFVPIALEASWKLPLHQGAVYLYSPTDQFRHALEKNNQVSTRLVVQDLFLELWKVDERPH